MRPKSPPGRRWPRARRRRNGRERDETERRERTAPPVDAGTQRLLDDWNAHADTAGEAGIHPLHAPGCGALVERIGNHAREAGVELPDPLAGVLEEHKPLARAAQAAEKIAPRLEACNEWRDELLRRADRKLRHDRPVVDLGWAHGRWRREADRVIGAARAILGDERHTRQLDELGVRAKIEAAVERLERAAMLDHLPARMVADREKIDDRVRETGTHRFFLAEHESVCERMSSLHRMDSTAWQFAREEIDIRDDMSVDAEWLADRVKTLQECADGRGRWVRAGRKGCLDRW